MRGLVSIADYEKLEHENVRLRDQIAELKQRLLDAHRTARADFKHDMARRAAPVNCGPICVDFASTMVSVGGRDTRLTPHEYRVVEVLALTPGAFVPKWSIYDHLYREPDYGPDLKIIDVFVCKVRRKLGVASGYIQNAHGRGYRLVAPA